MIRQISARPLFLMLIGLILGLNFPTIAWIFGVGVVLATLFKIRPAAWLCAGVFVAGFIALSSQPPLLEQGEFRGNITLTGFAEYRNGQTWVPFRQGTLKIPGQLPVAAFETWQIEGTVTEAKNGVLRAERASRVSTSAFSIVGAIRLNAIRHINTLYGDRDGAWINALTFNFASDLERSDKANLVNSGTYHLVSASGLHVWVLAFMGQFALILLSVRREVQILLVGALLTAYCLLTGFHPPTARSALMWLIVSSAYLFRRSPDGISALSLSGILWLGFAPNDVFTPSFQLSYVVTSTLIIWFERGRTQLSEYGWKRGLAASCVASLSAEPLGAWWFGRVVFIGPITNLLVELASSVLVVCGFLSVIPGVGLLASLIARPILWGVQQIVEISSRSPHLTIIPRSVSPAMLVVYYLLLLGLLWSRPHRGPALTTSTPEELEPRP